MRRIYLVRLTEEHARTLFWFSETMAAACFALIVLAILFAPFLIGFLPDVEAQIVGGLD